MYLWSLTIINISKPHPPTPPSDVFSMNITSGLLILVIVALISFSIGAIVALKFRPGRKEGTQLSEVYLSVSGNPGNPGNWSQNVSRGNTRAAANQPPRWNDVSDPSMSPEPSTSSSMSADYENKHERLYTSSPAIPPTAPPLASRENPLNDKRWFGLAQEDVQLFSELDELSSKVDAPRQEMIRHVNNRLREILARSGVEVISRDPVYDIYRHQIEQSDHVVAPGTPIAEIVSPGFAINGRVLRPARVRVVGAPSDDGRGNRDK